MGLLGKKKEKKESGNLDAAVNKIENEQAAAPEKTTPEKVVESPEQQVQNALDVAGSILGKNVENIGNFKEKEPILVYDIPKALQETPQNELTQEEFKEMFSSIGANVLHAKLSASVKFGVEQETFAHTPAMPSLVWAVMHNVDENRHKKPAQERDDSFKELLTDHISGNGLEYAANEKFIDSIVNTAMKKAAFLASSELADFNNRPEAYQGREREMEVKKDLNLAGLCVFKTEIETKTRAEWGKAYKKECERAAFESIPGLSSQEIKTGADLWRSKAQMHTRKISENNYINYYDEKKKNPELIYEYESAKNLVGMMEDYRDAIVKGKTQEEKRDLGDKIKSVIKKDFAGEYGKEESKAINIAYHTNGSFGLKSASAMRVSMEKEQNFAKREEAKNAINQAQGLGLADKQLAMAFGSPAPSSDVKIEKVAENVQEKTQALSR